MDERLIAIGLARPAVATPAVVVRPSAVARQAVRLRDGLRDRDALCELERAGLRLSHERETRTIAWRDLVSLSLERGRIRLVTRDCALAFAPAIDGVIEPSLVPLFAAVLREGRAGRLDPHTGALHELANETDRLLDDFADADDPIVPLAIGVFAALATVIFLVAIPYALQLAARITPAPGAFVVAPRVGWFDPRALLAAAGAAAAFAVAVGRAGVGAPALTWARGTARGWHRDGFGLEERARRLIAGVVLEPRLPVGLAIAALLAFAPSAFARTVVDEGGIHAASGLPFLSRDRAWSEVRDVVPIAVGIDERAEGFSTMLVFTDGSRLSTRDRDLVGGSERAFFDFARSRLP